MKNKSECEGRLSDNRNVKRGGERERGRKRMSERGREKKERKKVARRKKKTRDDECESV